MTSQSKFILAGLLVLLALVLMVQNATVVRVHFLLWSLALSQSLVILLALGVGAVLGWVGGSVRPLPKSLRPK
jgi:uncharacterized integral membrane protein